MCEKSRVSLTQNYYIVKVDYIGSVCVDMYEIGCGRGQSEHHYRRYSKSKLANLMILKIEIDLTLGPNFVYSYFIFGTWS